MLPLAWPDKAPADCLDFSLDASDWLAGTRDTLAGLQVTYPTPASATDLRVLWCTILCGQAVLFLAGGQPCRRYAIQIVLISGAGRVRAVQVLIQVTGDGPAVPPGPTAPQWPPNAAILPGGVVIPDQTGAQPLILA